MNGTNPLTYPGPTFIPSLCLAANRQSSPPLIWAPAISLSVPMANTSPRGGGGNQLVWSANGKTITAVVGKEGKASLVTFDVASGKETDVTSGNQAIVSFRAAPDVSKFVYLISTPTRIGDLFFLDR